MKAPKASESAKLIKIADKISNNRGLLTKAPQHWTPERIRGYFLWSQLVCNEMKHVNEVLDKEIEEVFEKSGVNKFTSEEKASLIEVYYKSLDKE